VKPVLYTIVLGLVLSGVVLIGFYLIANILETYAVYVGIYPFGTWTYPLAWLAPLVRIAGQIVAILTFILFVAFRSLRGKT